MCVDDVYRGETRRRACGERDMRRFFVCESRELSQKVVQVGGHGFDDDSIDTSFAEPLDFVEDCVGVALKGGLGVAVGYWSSDARHPPQRHLEVCLAAEFVDLGERSAHLIWRRQRPY